MRIFLLITAMMQFLNIAPFPQNTDVTFSQNTITTSFPNTATFSISIASVEKVTDVELLYGSDERTCSDVQALALPEFTPGTRLQVSWEWDMRDGGGLPPGAEIWWQWKVANGKGETVTSEKQTKTWLDDIHPWQKKVKDSIRLQYYGISNQQADGFLETATTASDRLKTDTGMEASGIVDLFMYPNTEDMRDALLYEPTWTGGMAFTENNKIVLGMNGGDITWTKRTEAHELTHVLVGNYTFTCLWTSPTWLEEGLAVYGEGSPDENTVKQFESAKEKNNLLSFRILSASFSEDSDQANLSYSQSYYMVNYLIEQYGRDKINRLLKNLSQGMTIDEALSSVYGFNLAGFEKEWRKSIGVPQRELQGSTQSTEIPTQIPTMQPISGLKQVNILPSSLTTIAPIPSSTTNAAVPAGVEQTIPTITPLPPIETTNGSNSTTFILIITGLLVTGVVIFLVIRSKNKKKLLISAIIILILTSTILSARPVLAGNLSAQKIQYPVLSTATPYSPPPAEKGDYYNPDIGIRIKIPSNAKLDTSKANSITHFQIVIGDEVVGYLFSTSLSDGVELQEIAHTIRDNELDGLIEIEHQDDEQIKLNDGKAAWLTVSDARNPKEFQKLRLSLVTVKGYTSVTSLLFISSIAGFKTYLNDIDNMNKSIQVSAPVLNGFTRDELLVINRSESDNPTENDPATSISSRDFYLTFSGLVAYNSFLELTPDLAENWDVSEDGLTYTFHLQPNAVFHNMRRVTAEDVVYSWERAAKPETKSDTVMTYLGDIRGIKDMHEGNAEHISGLKIIDDHTLQVTLQNPVPYFLLKLTYPTGYIVDRENVEKSKTWYITPNGTGPFRLTRWESKKQILYERFDSFYGPKPKIKALLIRLYQGTGQQLYEQGLIDYTGIAYSDLVRFTDPSEPLSKQLHSNANMCTSYVTLDVTQPPFDDIKVRQAFALAIDKKEYVRVIDEGGSLAANGLYPPALPGFDKDFKGLEFDPEKAQVLLKESKYGSGEMPPIIFSVAGYGNSVSEGIAAMAQMWEENLGLKITIQNIDPEFYQNVLDTGKHGQLISEGWCADYPDPENFADVLFHSGNEMNRGHYSNPELDKLLEEARVEEDVTKRMEMYSKAEKIIVNDVPAIFWTHSNSYVLVKPYLQGYTGTPIGIPLERYMWIDGDKFIQ